MICGFLSEYAVRSLGEVARALRITPQAVGKAERRAIRKLRRSKKLRAFYDLLIARRTVGLGSDDRVRVATKILVKGINASRAA